jgi:hypothetical protein
MIWLWLLLSIWAAILLLLATILAVDQIRWLRYQHRRRAQVIDFTRRKVG